MRSSDHSGFVLSLRKLNCVTYSLCGTSLPLQKDSIDITALFLKYEQRGLLAACLPGLAWAFFRASSGLSDLPSLEDSWYFPATLVVRH